MIDHEKLMGWRFPEIRQDYTAKDTILYALGVGCGDDPVAPDALRHVYEDGLEALPSMVTILGYPGFWLREPGTGVDWRCVVHAGQSFELFRPLAATGAVIGRSRVTAVIDKGPGKPALVGTTRELVDAASGAIIATLSHTALLRGHGGFGGPAGASEPAIAMPDRAPDVSIALATLPQAALIYRLSGDLNPLHADPAVAREAGFARPILHGLATMGVATRALLREGNGEAGGNRGWLRRMSVRFAAPVLPGEKIHTLIWRDGRRRLFQARTKAGGVVLDGGLAEWAWSDIGSS